MAIGGSRPCCGQELAHEPQAGGADLARQRAPCACPATKAQPVVAEQRVLRAAAPGAAKPRVGPRLGREQDPGRAPVLHAAHGGRGHPTMPGHPGRTRAGLRRRLNRLADLFIAWAHPGSSAQTKAASSRPRPEGLGRRRARQHGPQRAGQLVGERHRGTLQRQAQGRAAPGRGVQRPGRSQGADRAMAGAQQHGAAALGPGPSATGHRPPATGPEGGADSASHAAKLPRANKISTTQDRHVTVSS